MIICRGQKSYSLHREWQNQTLFNNVSNTCQHTVNMDNIHYTQLCGKCSVAGSLEKSSVFCSVCPCLWCKYSHHGPISSYQDYCKWNWEDMYTVSSQELVWVSSSIPQFIPITWMKKKEDQVANPGPQSHTQENACFLGAVRQAHQFHHVPF